MQQRYIKMMLSFLIMAWLCSCGDSSPSSYIVSDTPSMKHLGETSRLSQSNANVSTIATNSVAINAGGGVTVNWIADTDYSMTGHSGTTHSSVLVDTTRVINPAPNDVYLNQRYATHLTYVIPNLLPYASYNVRLHFVESYFHAVQQRVFNITINKTQVTKNLDIFKEAGGSNIALIQQFGSTADATGTATITLDASINNASVAGIEVIYNPISTFYVPTAPAAPKLSLNPNPFSERICASDPCSPVIDPNSTKYNAQWFGSAPFFGQIAPAIPDTPTGVAYESIPIYASTNLDPSYTIISNVSLAGPYSGVHIPDGARADASGQDFLFDVIDATTGLETNGFEFNNGNTTTPLYDNGTTTQIIGGAPNPIYMYGGGQAKANCLSGQKNTCQGGSAASIPQSADELDPVDLLLQFVPHKLHLVAGCVAKTFVYPAGSSGGAGPPGCPPTGEFLWLDLPDARIETLTIPRWAKTLYHNLHDYGWTVNDNGPSATGSANQFALQLVSDYSWTAIGRPSQWKIMLAEMAAEGTILHEAGGGTTYQIKIPIAAGLTVSNFHWVRYNAANQ